MNMRLFVLYLVLFLCFVKVRCHGEENSDSNNEEEGETSENKERMPSKNENRKKNNKFVGSNVANDVGMYSISIIGEMLGSDAFIKFSEITSNTYKNIKNTYKYIAGYFKNTDKYVLLWWPRVLDIITEGDVSYCVKNKMKNLETHFRDVVREEWEKSSLHPEYNLDVILLSSLREYMGTLQTHFKDEYHTHYGSAALKIFVNNENLTYISWVWDYLPEKRKEMLEKIHDYESTFKRKLHDKAGDWWDSVVQYIAEIYDYYIENSEETKLVFQSFVDNLYDQMKNKNTNNNVLFRKERFMDDIMKQFVYQMSFYGKTFGISKETLKYLRMYMSTNHWQTMDYPTMNNFSSLHEKMNVYYNFDVLMRWWFYLSYYLDDNKKILKEELNTTLSLLWFNATQTACKNVTKIDANTDKERVLKTAFKRFNETLYDNNYYKNKNKNKYAEEENMSNIPYHILNRMQHFMNLNYEQQKNILEPNQTTPYYNMS